LLETLSKFIFHGSGSLIVMENETFDELLARSLTPTVLPYIPTATAHR